MKKLTLSLKPKQKKQIPFPFVLELLESAMPEIKPMFGCHAIYVGPRITLILREREDEPNDNGVWLATTGEHHASLKNEFPSMRSIELFGPGPTGWQNIPASAHDFESSVERACQLILQGDPRIGKIPKPKKLKKPRKLRSETPSRKKRKARSD